MDLLVGLGLELDPPRRAAGTVDSGLSRDEIGGWMGMDEEGAGWLGLGARVGRGFGWRVGGFRCQCYAHGLDIPYRLLVRGEGGYVYVWE